MARSCGRDDGIPLADRVASDGARSHWKANVVGRRCDRVGLRGWGFAFWSATAAERTSAHLLPTVGNARGQKRRSMRKWTLCRVRARRPRRADCVGKAHRARQSFAALQPTGIYTEEQLLLALGSRRRGLRFPGEVLEGMKVWNGVPFSLGPPNAPDAITADLGYLLANSMIICWRCCEWHQESSEVHSDVLDGIRQFSSECQRLYTLEALPGKPRWRAHRIASEAAAEGTVAPFTFMATHSA